MIDVLVRHRVEFVEQPLAAHDLDGLRFVRERSPLPIIADESCVTSADIPRLVGAVDGINIKLAKCGGLREALRMIAAARTHGMLVMCGCMIETSLGITAAAHLAPLLDYADLDGAALVANDPFIGASIAGGRIALRDAPGPGRHESMTEPRFVEVALPLPLFQTFTYAVDREPTNPVVPGTRVIVPVRKRRAVGICVDTPQGNIGQGAAAR